MNEKVLKTLEYNKIIEKLVSLAASRTGKELATNLVPSIDIDEITLWQKETSDALSLVYQKGSLSFSGISDIRPSIKRLSIGSSLGIEEFLRISSLLDAVTRAKAYKKKDTESSSYDSLDERFSSLETIPTLNNEIKRCIISEEEISDDASPTLRHIRRSIKNANEQIHKQLNTMLNSQSTRTLLQENIITMRNGRYCLPVKQEYMNQFGGMIHDRSSSGSTLFIEPMAVVKLNNDLKELSIKENDEIEKILLELSNMASEYVEVLSINMNTMSELDFIFAKALLAKQYKASEPIFNTNGYINIKKGRHPLLDSSKVVPIDISLGNEYHLLIITGPNTGGKTVSLKTAGLFTLMGQAGLHIPAFDKSELSVFENVYADIGDEQSIEQNLSTFSSHMTNIISIVENASYNSLVLFDELGAGTDPVEGAALAISILSHLHQKQIRTMATTHYSELKIFALNTEGIQNAGCEFNVETLKPTYRLVMGIPGKSNAFAISSKLGLPDFIINDAKSKIDTSAKHFEDVISDLESSRITIEKEQADIETYKKEIQDLKNKLKQKHEKLDAAKERILREANEKAYQIISDAKAFADKSIKNYNKWSKEIDLGKDMERERNTIRGKLSNLESDLSLKKPTKPKKKHKPSDFRQGDAVKVLSLGLNGTVSTLPNQKGDLFVQMGILRSMVNISDLELIDEDIITAPNIQKSSSGQIKMSKTAIISPEINLIGKTVDEAVPLLDKYLDDAYLSHLPQVTVIHGRGTGALRNGIHSHLKKLKYVKSYRVGGFGEGDGGVTIVEF